MDNETREMISQMVHQAYSGEIKALVRDGETIVFKVCSRFPPPPSGATVVVRVNGAAGKSLGNGYSRGGKPITLAGRISYPRIGQISIDTANCGVPRVHTFASRDVAIRGKVVVIVRSVTDEC